MKQLLRPTLKPNDIVVHVDTGNDKAGDKIKQRAGFEFPLLKFRNTVIEWIDIRTFDLAIGDSFLPTLMLSWGDETGSIVDTDWPTDDDTITVFIGNNKDTSNTPIHSDFRIVSISKSESGVVSVKAELRIPNWKQSSTKQWVDGTGFEAIQLFCQALGLGLISNITNSLDVDSQNQYTESNSKWLKDTLSDLWLGDDTTPWCFIDANYNLNIIAVPEAFNQSTNRSINFNVRTGKALAQPVPLVLTDNRAGSQPEWGCKVNNWVPVNRVGSNKQNKPSAAKWEITYKNYGTGTVEQDSVTTMIADQTNAVQNDLWSSSDESITSNAITTSTTSDESSFSTIASGHNSILRTLLIEGAWLKVNLSTPIFMVALGDTIELKLYTHPAGSNDLNEDTKSTTGTIKALSDRNKQILSTTYSGSYLILSTRYSWSTGSEIINQQLRLTKRLWSKQHSHQTGNS